MSQDTTILFVAFEFPPLASGGVQRSLYFVKYLPESGIKPIVITPEMDDIPKVIQGARLDNSLLAEIPSGTIIERVHCLPSKRSTHPLVKWVQMFFSVTEVFKRTWRPGLDRQLPKIIQRYKPSAIYVSIPPFAMVPLWLDILKKYSIPLIIDFRDAWSQWAIAPNGTYLHYWKKKSMEHAVLKKAAAVVVSSEQTRLDLLRVHPDLEARKLSVITNGFDKYPEVQEKLLISEKNKMIIGYVGNFYYEPSAREEIFKPWWKKKPQRMLNYYPVKEDWLYRSPYFFFRSLRKMLDLEPGWADRIEIHFAGNEPAWLKEQIHSFGLDGICRHTGFLNHDEVILFQQQCDLLLLTSAKVIGGRDYSIAGKTYEYFSMGKPILGFVCEGAQKDMLERSGMALICDPDNSEESAQKLIRMLKGEVILHPSESYIHQFHRKKLTNRLSELIRDIVTAN